MDAFVMYDPNLSMKQRGSWPCIKRFMYGFSVGWTPNFIAKPWFCMILLRVWVQEGGRQRSLFYRGYVCFFSFVVFSLTGRYMTYKFGACFFELNTQIQIVDHEWMAVNEIYPKPFGQAKEAEQIYRNLMKSGIQKLHMTWIILNHHESM